MAIHCVEPWAELWWVTVPVVHDHRPSQGGIVIVDPGCRRSLAVPARIVIVVRPPSHSARSAGTRTGPTSCLTHCYEHDSERRGEPHTWKLRTLVPMYHPSYDALLGTLDLERRVNGDCTKARSFALSWLERRIVGISHLPQLLPSYAAGRTTLASFATAWMWKGATPAFGSVVEMSPSF
jgi:hypothetical protein